MKTKLFFLMLVCTSVFMFSSCSDDDGSESGDIGGNQSEFGQVGNEIEVGPISDVSGINVKVTALNNGVSTFTGRAATTNSTYIDLLEMVPTERFPGSFTVSGNTVEAQVNAKVTDQGAAVVFNDGTLLKLVDYNASVGNKYTANVGGTTLVNEVISKSTEDDFYWNGMNIKVIKVKYKSHSPGIKEVVHIYNHKFGVVGLDVYFEDGSVKYIGLTS